MSTRACCAASQTKSRTEVDMAKWLWVNNCERTAFRIQIYKVSCVKTTHSAPLSCRVRPPRRRWPSGSGSWTAWAGTRSRTCSRPSRTPRPCSRPVRSGRRRCTGRDRPSPGTWPRGCTSGRSTSPIRPSRWTLQRQRQVLVEGYRRQRVLCGTVLGCRFEYGGIWVKLLGQGCVSDF